MKRYMPWLRLGLFCLALFGISAAAMLLKQGRLLKDQHEQQAGGGSVEDGASATAALMGGHSVPGSEAAASDPAHRAAGTEEALRDRSLAKGRALFDLPEPISIADASDLLNELKRQKTENEARKATLDQKEKELAAIEREIEQRRTEVLALTAKLQSGAPIAATAEAGAPIDPKTLSTFAKVIDTMPADAAARFLEQSPPEHAALILLQMEKSKAAAALPLITGEKLDKLREALLHVSSGE